MVAVEPSGSLEATEERGARASLERVAEGAPGLGWEEGAVRMAHDCPRMEVERQTLVALVSHCLLREFLEVEAEAAARDSRVCSKRLGLAMAAPVVRGRTFRHRPVGEEHGTLAAGDQLGAEARPGAGETVAPGWQTKFD